MTNYMFRPFGGHHQVLYKIVKRIDAIYTFFYGSDISDRPGCWNGITKSMVVYPSLYIIQLSPWLFILN
jgi:hypothetical protein